METFPTTVLVQVATAAAAGLAASPPPHKPHKNSLGLVRLALEVRVRVGRVHRRDSLIRLNLSVPGLERLVVVEAVCLEAYEDVEGGVERDVAGGDGAGGVGTGVVGERLADLRADGWRRGTGGGGRGGDGVVVETVTWGAWCDGCC